jgi:hypothetical protein
LTGTFAPCLEYGRWQRLRRSGLKVDFRHICRFDSGPFSYLRRFVQSFRIEW